MTTPVVVEKVSPEDLQYRYPCWSYTRHWGKWTNFLKDIGEYETIESIEHERKQRYIGLKNELKTIPNGRQWNRKIGGICLIYRQYGSWVNFLSEMENKPPDEIGIKKTCISCGKEFLCSVERGHWKTHCTIKCGVSKYREDHKEELMALDRARHYRKYPRLDKKCLICKKNFVTGNTVYKYCSPECREEWWRIERARKWRMNH